DLHPDANGFGRRVRDERLMVVPRAARTGWIERPLLVHEGARIADDAVVPLRVEPGHRECSGGSGTAAHGRTRVRIACESDSVARLDLGQHLTLDVFGKRSRH